jgi:uncharacterized protein (DUF169 family)
MMPDYTAIAAQFESQLRLATYPIAIRMLKLDDPVPPDAIKPRKDMGTCVSTCQLYSLARRQGTTFVQLKDDMWCFEPVVGLGLGDPPQEFLDGKNRYPSDVRTLECGARYAKNLPKFAQNQYKGIMIAPLKTADFIPDVVVLYVNPAQLTLLLLGMAYDQGEDLTTTLSGHAACIFALVPTIQDQKIQVAVPCWGDRRRAIAQDDEMIFAIPIAKLDSLVTGLRHIEKTGRRMPVNFTMNYEYPLNAYAPFARSLGMTKADGSEIK